MDDLVTLLTTAIIDGLSIAAFVAFIAAIMLLVGVAGITLAVIYFALWIAN